MFVLLHTVAYVNVPLVRTMLRVAHLDPVYTIRDPHGYDIKLKSLKTSVASYTYDSIAEFNNK